MGIFTRLATGGLYGGRQATSTVNELKRTCDRCGHEWYVTPAEARLRAPSGLKTGGLKMQAAGNRMKLVGGKKKAMIAEQRIARAERDQERYELVNRCGNCGSVSFTQTPA